MGGGKPARMARSGGREEPSRSRKISSQHTEIHALSYPVEFLAVLNGSYATVDGNATVEGNAGHLLCLVVSLVGRPRSWQEANVCRNRPGQVPCNFTSLEFLQLAIRWYFLQY